MAHEPQRIQTLLLDADGVVQTSAAGFARDLQALCPDTSKHQEFLADIFAAEKPCLTGERDFPQALKQVLRAWGADVPVSEALALWSQIEPVNGILSAVSGLRTQDIRVCLATNQQAHRARVMIDHLGYSAYFDDLFFSCELGFAKPSSHFFKAILQRVGTSAHEMLFIDDHASNVAAARAVGMAAEVYHTDHGLGRFQSILARYALATSCATP